MNINQANRGLPLFNTPQASIHTFESLEALESEFIKTFESYLLNYSIVALGEFLENNQKLFDDSPHLLNFVVTEGEYTGLTFLSIAAGSQNWSLVKFMLKINPDINLNASLTHAVEQGMTPFWLAANAYRWDVVEVMLTCGAYADIDASPAQGSMRGMSALWMAADRRQWDIVRLMLNHKPNCNINVGSAEASSPLLIAAAENQWDIVEFMVAHHPHVDFNEQPKDKLGTAFWFASAAGQVELMKFMLKTSSNIDLNVGSYRPSCNYIPISNLISNCHAKIPLEEYLKTTPLWHAATRRQWDFAKQLLQYNRKPHLFDDYNSILEMVLAACKKIKSNSRQKEVQPEFEVGFCCVLFGAMLGHNQIVRKIKVSIEKAFREIICSHEIKFNELSNALFVNSLPSREYSFKNLIAAQLRKLCPQIAFLPDRLLLGKIISYFKIQRILNNSDTVGNTFFKDVVAKYGEFKCIELLEAGTICHYAASKGNLEVMRFLIQELRNSNRVDLLLQEALMDDDYIFVHSPGRTPLHYAASQDLMDLSRLLVEACPFQLKVKDEQRLNAGVIANKHGHRELALYLIKAGLNLPTTEMPAALGEKTEEPFHKVAEVKKHKIEKLTLKNEVPTLHKRNISQNQTLQKAASQKKLQDVTNKLSAEEPKSSEIKTTATKVKRLFKKPQPDSTALEIKPKKPSLQTLPESSTIAVKSADLEVDIQHSNTLHAPSETKAEARKNAQELLQRDKQKSDLKKRRSLIITSPPAVNFEPKKERPSSTPSVQTDAKIQDLKTNSDRHKRLSKRASEADLNRPASIKLDEALIVSTLEKLHADNVIDYRRKGNTISANKINDHSICLTIHMHSTMLPWYRKPEIVREFIQFVQACDLNLKQ